MVWIFSFKEELDPIETSETVVPWHEQRTKNPAFPNLSRRRRSGLFLGKKLKKVRTSAAPSFLVFGGIPW
jgi:hypothetical protein